MKRFFLIDTENIGYRYFPGIENLTGEDKVILFHYAEAKPISIEVMGKLANSKANIEIKEMNCHSKNAMDFQICTYIGILTGKYGSSAEYYIISEDNGYEAAIEFIKNNFEGKVTIEEVRDFNKTTRKAAQKISIDEILMNYPKKVRKVTLEGVRRTHSSGELHNYLQKNLPTDGTTIYQIVKDYREELIAA